MAERGGNDYEGVFRRVSGRHDGRRITRILIGLVVVLRITIPSQVVVEALGFVLRLIWNGLVRDFHSSIPFLTRLIAKGQGDTRTILSSILSKARTHA